MYVILSQIFPRLLKGPLALGFFKNAGFFTPKENIFTISNIKMVPNKIFICSYLSKLLLHKKREIPYTNIKQITGIPQVAQFLRPRKKFA